MQPGSGAPSTVPCTSPGTWASRAAFTRGSAHPAGALCHHGSCILHRDLHQILSHHVSCSCDCPRTLLHGHLSDMKGVSSSNPLAVTLLFTCLMLQMQLQVTSLLQKAGEIFCIQGKGSPWTWLSCGGEGAGPAGVTGSLRSQQTHRSMPGRG